MRRLPLLIVAAFATAGTTFAAERPPGLKEAETAAKAALGVDCLMRDPEETPVVADGTEDEAGHTVYTVKYRPSWYSADQPDAEATLYKLLCSIGAYNLQSAFVIKTPDDEVPRLLSFANPELGLDYADEDQTTLKNPPRITGYKATSILVNARFDPQTATITSRGLWRGIGDAWDHGRWVFRDDAFVLTRYEVNPTFDGFDNEKTDEGITILDLDGRPKP
ncbi:Protein of unknown function [Rhizobium sp. RU20A]|uniref:DUF1176 domain-containing protein n=1 Tax=Rhizobium sp. RU20A TaxID=1907412 RepID=UPI000953E6E0|nr:DUF1176 domain-containing protein [Rhizobium sp. RU20A]SIQ13824.1 Protein of unknown function [Rhizobium sp. RU20A]